MESGSKAEQKVAMLRKRKAERQARSKTEAEEKAAAAAAAGPTVDATRGVHDETADAAAREAIRWHTTLAYYL